MSNIFEDILTLLTDYKKDNKIDIDIFFKLMNEDDLLKMIKDVLLYKYTKNSICESIKEEVNNEINNKKYDFKIISKFASKEEDEEFYENIINVIYKNKYIGDVNVFINFINKYNNCVDDYFYEFMMLIKIIYTYIKMLLKQNVYLLLHIYLLNDTINDFDIYKECVTILILYYYNNLSKRYLKNNIKYINYFIENNLHYSFTYAEYKKYYNLYNNEKYENTFEQLYIYPETIYNNFIDKFKSIDVDNYIDLKRNDKSN